MNEPSRRPVAGLGLWLVAAPMLACGLCSALVYIILPLTDTKSASTIETNTVLGALAGLGLTFAALLGWQGLNAYRGRDPVSADRVFPPVIAFALALFGAIFLGVGALSLTPVAAYIFPPWHFFAAMLIPLTFLAYAARRLGQRSRIDALVASFTWGALGATFIALIAEALVLAISALAAFVLLSLIPGGQVTLEQIRAQFAPFARNPNQLDQLLSSPIAATALLVYVAILIPPIEEALKTLVLGFLDPQRMRQADAILWGMAAGAGFAAFENLFNTATLLNTWAIVIVMRIGATIMHIANGVTMGRGWYAARVERRWGKLFIAYALSVLFHAIWNGSVILLSRSALSFSSDANAAVQKLLAQGALVFSLIGVIGVLALGGLVWIAYAIRQAQTSLQPDSSPAPPRAQLAASDH